MYISLMSAGRKICRLLDINEDDVTELFFTEHATFGEVKHKGILLKSIHGSVIVPDIENAEKLFIYPSCKTRDLTVALHDHGYTQTQIAGMLKVAQPTICRILKEEKETNIKGGK